MRICQNFYGVINLDIKIQIVRIVNKLSNMTYDQQLTCLLLVEEIFRSNLFQKKQKHQITKTLKEQIKNTKTRKQLKNIKNQINNKNNQKQPNTQKRHKKNIKKHKKTQKTLNKTTKNIQKQRQKNSKRIFYFQQRQLIKFLDYIPFELILK
ncbi:hypothetical protein pb186bvf_015572 [Paramecium bursaria]